ncbi:hypothetical protein [Burkholderia metallica]|uniref:Uncharacterized protein n=1 Tax=Burkholderia metallica TaxID=488729 RepID=A0ABT8P800_9BURK|nr:hypothetical protein [Burkholderia metallica]MCA8018271.1 hypothetical protein [Burkholderia metallica]MDN7931216.1 hypothetical protein [Burkholderia metallica]
MAPILPEPRRAPVPGARIRLFAMRAATRCLKRRGDGMNKKRARRGTEHKTGPCCEIDAAGTDQRCPVRSNQYVILIK